MLESLASNLWLVLTLVLPGLFTYGAWRVILLLEPSRRLPVDALSKFDNSALVTTCIIVVVALLQQAVAIVLEAGLSVLARIMRRKWPNFYTLFCERFGLACAGKLDENATRIIGNFFLSINISVGLGLLLVYFLTYESMALTQAVPTGLMIFLAATLTTTVYRMLNAIWVVEECRDHQPNKRLEAME
jgi:hypothetical protein